MYIDKRTCFRVLKISKIGVFFRSCVLIKHFGIEQNGVELNFKVFLCLRLNRAARIRHQCRKTTVLTCHRCLINAGVKK